MSTSFELMGEDFIASPQEARAVSSGNERSHRAGSTLSSSGDPAFEAVHRIFLSAVQSRPRVVVFAGVEAGSGSGEMAISVARHLADTTDQDVCLLDANFRSPQLQHMEHVGPYGLSDVLRDGRSTESCLKQMGPGRLWCLSSGSTPQTSLNLLTPERLQDCFTDLRARFGYLVVCGAPLNSSPDAIALGCVSDGVVLVLAAQSTRRAAALTAVERLRSSRVPVLGAVLNRRNLPIPEFLYRRL